MRQKLQLDLNDETVSLFARIGRASAAGPLLGVAAAIVVLMLLVAESRLPPEERVQLFESSIVTPP